MIRSKVLYQGNKSLTWVIKTESWLLKKFPDGSQFIDLELLQWRGCQNPSRQDPNMLLKLHTVNFSPGPPKGPSAFYMCIGRKEIIRCLGDDQTLALHWHGFQGSRNSLWPSRQSRGWWGTGNQRSSRPGPAPLGPACPPTSLWLFPTCQSA